MDKISKFLLKWLYGFDPDKGTPIDLTKPEKKFKTGVERVKEIRG